MESVIQAASELPNCDHLTDADLAFFAERRFYPNAGNDSLRKEIRYGMVYSKNWYVQCKGMVGWRATRVDSTSKYGCDWQGQLFPNARAAYVDAELRGWGES